MTQAPVLSGRARAIVSALAVTQTVGYGCLYYSFAVFLAPVAAELGADRTTVTGAFTLAVLTAAALAVPVGRWLDRHGSRGLMTAGSVVGSLLLVAFAHVHSLTTLYLVWAAIGAVGAAVFYEAAFATVIAWTPALRRNTALLAVTLVAGFASSIFLPLTGLLIDRYGWRTAALLLAALHAAVTVPLHGLVLRRPVPATRRPAPPRTRREGRQEVPDDGDARRRAAVRTATRDPRYWLLGIAFTAQSAAIATMTLHLIGFLTAAGHPATTAATVTGLLGVLSVTGRVVVTAAARNHPAHRVVALVFAVQAAAALALPALAGNIVTAVAGVICFGLGFGISNIARPALLTQLFGTVGYATLSGVLAVPVTLALATAPLATAALQHSTGSYRPVLLAVAACCAIAACSIAASDRGARGQDG